MSEMQPCPTTGQKRREMEICAMTKTILIIKIAEE
jgi:hypothetical protein